MADFNQGTLPSGTTFEITSVTGSLGCSVSCFELDSNGVLKVKSGTVFSNEVNSNHWSPEADANGIIREAEMINRLASFEANGDSKRENHTGIINIVITPPNEEPILRSIDLSPVRVEGQENVVMKFSGDWTPISSHNKDKPFEYSSAKRGTDSTKSYNASINVTGDSITESTLASPQLEGNIKIDSVISLDNGGIANYAQSVGTETFYRTNTIANGKNENDTGTLDFEYKFPIDNFSSGEHLATGTNNTLGLYAPLAVANADWDNEVESTEKAKYGCLK